MEADRWGDNVRPCMNLGALERWRGDTVFAYCRSIVVRSCINPPSLKYGCLESLWGAQPSNRAKSHVT